MPIPVTLDPHGIAVMVLTVLALILFTRESIPLETSSLAVLVLLITGFSLFPHHPAAGSGQSIHPEEFLLGFGHEALVAVCALMVAGQGLVRTGALEPVGRSLARLWDFSPKLCLLLTLMAASSLSAVINNVPIVVLFLPILVGIAVRTGRSASGVLMPMGFATLIGGMTTTIGTSTNLLVISIAADLGVRPFGMFDFFPLAAGVGAVALLYLWLVAPALLPEREMPLGGASPRQFTGHLVVEEGSACAGRTLAEAMDMTRGGLKAREIFRPPHLLIKPLPDVILRPGDRLGVSGVTDHLMELSSVLGTSLYSGNNPVDSDNPLPEADQQLAELVVTQGSSLDNSTLSQARFAENYGLVTLALHRYGGAGPGSSEKVGDVRLRVGDVLLVQGPTPQLAALKKGGEFLVLDGTADLPRKPKAPLALAIMAAIVLLAATGILPTAVSACCGVLAMILSRCLRWRDALQALSLPIIMIVVASLALGTALVKTGGAAYIAHAMVGLFHGAPPAMVISALMAIMAVLTNVVSNNSAAVIGTPIAVNLASQLGFPAEPFVLAVLFGANMSYATPIAYKTNLLVMNAGGYRFGDFIRVGGPLTLLIWLGLSWLLPMVYGL